LAIGSEGGVSIWDLPRPGASARLWGRLNAPGCARVLVFSPDGVTLAGGGSDGAVVLWDAGARDGFAAASLLLQAHSHRVDALAFSHDGRLLATAGGRPPAEGN